MIKKEAQLSCRGNTIYSDEHQKLIECKTCGFIHISPYPQKEALDSMYKNNFYESEKPDYISKFENEKDYWFAVYKERFSQVERLLKTNKRRVLDIGSSIGYFLKVGQEIGWEVLGIEPSQFAANYANNMGVETIADVFENIDLEQLGTFSFIHMSLVLEHIINPTELIAKCRDLLEVGGCLCIEVPNEFNPLQELLVNQIGTPQYWITTGKTPHHLNYFNQRSLKKLVNKVGFDVKYITSTFPMELFVLMGDNYIGNNEVGKNCHTKRMTFEMNLLSSKRNIKSELYQRLNQLDLGREIIVFGVKG